MGGVTKTGGRVTISEPILEFFRDYFWQRYGKVDVSAEALARELGELISDVNESVNADQAAANIESFLKDNSNKLRLELESCRRNVCSLCKEKRVLIKENAELTRRLIVAERRANK